MSADSETRTSRTNLAEDRTLLANERTFAGWLRTSLATVAIGVGFHAVFGEMQPDWLPRAVATAFLLLAMVLVALAERRATAVLSRLNPHAVATSRPMNLRLFTAVTILGAATLIGAIWFAL